jgi:hypothetical protein
MESKIASKQDLARSRMSQKTKKFKIIKIHERDFAPEIKSR